MELNKTRSPEARMMISAAVVDDVLGLAILGVIVSFITSSTSITALGVVEVIAWSLALWLGITVFLAIILPRIINFMSKGKSEGPLEAAATAACFGASALAAALGLILNRWCLRSRHGNRQFPHDREDTRIHQENKHNLLSSVLCTSRCPIQHPKFHYTGLDVLSLLHSLGNSGYRQQDDWLRITRCILLKGPR